jgi:hypothetical protein
VHRDIIFRLKAEATSGYLHYGDGNNLLAKGSAGQLLEADSQRSYGTELNGQLE